MSLDPFKAANLMLEHIEGKRKALGPELREEERNEGRDHPAGTLHGLPLTEVACAVSHSKEEPFPGFRRRKSPEKSLLNTSTHLKPQFLSPAVTARMHPAFRFASQSSFQGHSNRYCKSQYVMSCVDC